MGKKKSNNFAATDEAVAYIQDAGFSHIKVELEGDLGRSSADRRMCGGCDDGRVECTTCDGEGVVRAAQLNMISSEEWEDCDDCSSYGYTSCDDCSGSGYESDFSDEDSCYEYMLGQVSQHAREVLTYGRFYEDGSVDSEYTFTVPISEWRTIFEWIEAFKDLANECSYLDVEGSGMHVSLLTSGDYPSHVRLPEESMRNFTSEVNKLLPALFFMASAGHQSRELGFRMPKVSRGDKYSAIYTHGNTCLEYRVFETCYDRPEAMAEYIQVIAKTLRYYVDPTLKAKQLQKEFTFFDGNGSTARFFNNTEQLRILNAQIKELKPEDKTIKQLKRDRGVAATIKQLKQQEKGMIARIRGDYKRYKKNWETIAARPLDGYQQRYYDQMIAEYGESPEVALLRARNQSKLLSMPEYIARNLTDALLQDNDCYSGTTITV